MNEEDKRILKETYELELEGCKNEDYKKFLERKIKELK